MKRLACAMLAMLILMMAAGVACAERPEQVFETDYFTLTIPGNWIIDEGDLEKAEDFEDLGSAYAPELIGPVIEAALVHYENMNDVSLWRADEDELQTYIDDVLADFRDDSPEYVKTLWAGGIPFVVIRAEDENGPYLYADTMTNGYALVFYGYVAMSGIHKTFNISDADYALLEQILLSFKPVLREG